MTDQTYAALCEALDDEYKAHATYQAVIAAFGPVMPFVQIMPSEEQHAAMLLELFRRRGWTPPADRWRGQVAAPGSLLEACEIGVAAEEENRAMYDRLLTMSRDVDVLYVFETLQAASAHCHLPAFRRAAERGGVAEPDGPSGHCGCHHRRQHGSPVENSQ